MILDWEEIANYRELKYAFFFSLVVFSSSITPANNVSFLFSSVFNQGKHNLCLLFRSNVIRMTHVLTTWFVKELGTPHVELCLTGVKILKLTETISYWYLCYDLFHKGMHDSPRKRAHTIDRYNLNQMQPLVNMDFFPILYRQRHLHSVRATKTLPKLSKSFLKVVV